MGGVRDSTCISRSSYMRHNCRRATNTTHDKETTHENDLVLVGGYRVVACIEHPKNACPEGLYIAHTRFLGVHDKSDGRIREVLPLLLGFRAASAGARARVLAQFIGRRGRR